MDYLLMIPALFLVVLLFALCLPFAHAKKTRQPRAEKEQMDKPQEEFLDAKPRESRNRS